MRGSDGYLIEEHPLLIIAAVAVLIVGMWWFLRVR